jgi:ABC-type nickel/cobalt efflux system permease component RcnA
LQRTVVSGLAAELHSGGMLTAALAFVLGALHALTPGHGKTALATYFLGQNAKLTTGIRVALTASLLHVVTGAAAFLVLRFIVGQMPAMTSRGPPFFAVTGYGLILLAGVIMTFQSLRSVRATAQPQLLTLGLGLLPCPLTITVLGFTWAQSAGPMVVVVLIALAAGISVTIGAVALLAIVAQRSLGRTFASRLSKFEQWTRVLQGFAGVAITTIAGCSIWAAV